MPGTSVQSRTLHLPPADRLKRQAILHLIDASALVGAVDVHADRVTLRHGASSGQLVLWRFAESLAGVGDSLLFEVRETDAECRRACVEALTIWCDLTVPGQRVGA